jgi:Zn-dependent peptidase ImmA (M78 family)
MNKAFRLKLAKQKAEAFLQAESITGLPVDPIAIAASRDIVVQAKSDADEGVSGMLLRHGDNFGILYATHIPNEGFQRFSISHELGHYFLDGHMDHVLPKDGCHISHAGFVSADPYELEADCFAAGLLMPGAAVAPIIGRHKAGLGTVEAINKACGTSLTAAAIRYAELTHDPVAVIVSTGKAIDCCFLSESMKTLPELAWLRKGIPVPPGTHTARFNSRPERVRGAERLDDEIDVMDWLGGKRSVSAVEEVIGLGRYGRTLTILTSVPFDDDDEGDEGADGEDGGWNPKFRR